MAVQTLLLIIATSLLSAVRAQDQILSGPGIAAAPPDVDKPPLTGITRVCLNGIMKDEADRITEMLASVVDHITTYVICDTGSTDGTQDIIRIFFAKAGVPGKVLQHEWMNDFAKNRNK